MTTIIPIRGIRSRRIVTPEGVVDGAVLFDDGRITAVLEGDVRRLDPLGGVGCVDAGSLVVMPGLVDSHVHVNAPGRETWEGWDFASRAAVTGGITTLVDMPLNSIPATVNLDAFEAKRARATATSVADFALWGGVVPGNAGALESLARAGVAGFKCFLVDSGVPEFPAVTEADLDAAMPVIARLGLPLLVHAEWPAALDRAAGNAGRDPRRHSSWEASRPPESEIEAIRVMIRLCERHRCRVHIVHLAAADALDDLRAARRHGAPITVETCPHYLYFASEDVPDGATEYKCAPPIRGAANRDRLRRALLDGDIDLVASDHSPCPPADRKRESGDFFAAWGGIASLQISLAATWTAMREVGAGIDGMARWMAFEPARLAGLGHRKGAIAPGRDADLVIWDPDATWTVDPRELHHRHSVTPYAGMTLRGRIEGVYQRGQVFSLAKDAGDAAASDDRWIPRGE